MNVIYVGRFRGWGGGSIREGDNKDGMVAELDFEHIILTMTREIDPFSGTTRKYLTMQIRDLTNVKRNLEAKSCSFISLFLSVCVRGGGYS